MFKLNKEYNFFQIDFMIENQQIEGSIAMSNELNEMTLYIAGFVSTLCDIDEFFNLIDEINAPDELFIGQNITIDTVKVKITSIDIETIEEYNSFWENIEVKELNDDY